VSDVSEPSALIDAVRALARLTRVVNPAVGDLSTADYRVMASIVSGEGRASRLASRLSLGKPTISATIESLSKRGLVVRSSVAGDSRATALSLSDEGAAVFEKVEARMARQLELLCERTPDGRQVVESLTWLGTVIEAAVTDRLERAERLDQAEQPGQAEQAEQAGQAGQAAGPEDPA
jgi:DNA-binding MarR family transcriptional regulator